MDLKQPLSFKSAGKNKKVVYPTKTTINLMSGEQARTSLITQIVLFVVVLALIGIFAKFAVVDPLAGSMAGSADVAAAQGQLDALKTENASYAELNKQYARYVVTGLTEEELNLVSRNTVLALLQEKVLDVGYLSSLKVVGNVATVTCLGADLNVVSKMVESLETDERVAHVTVSTAQGETDAGTSATIQIAFKGALDEAGDAAVADTMAQATGAGAKQ